MEIKNYFAQDAQGNIMPSANCYLYLPGTTTLAAGLVDGNGTPISNPFLASSVGQVEFGAPNGVYDLRVALGARDWTIKVQCADIVQAMDVIDSILGSHAENPTARNNGQPLQPGDETWNSTDKQPYWWTGSSWLSLNNSTNQLEGRLSDHINPDNGSSILGRGVVSIQSIFDLLQTPDPAKRTDLKYKLTSYLPSVIAPFSNPIGGGDFIWLPTLAKSSHNGVMVFSPTVPWDGSKSSLPAFMAKTGEADPSGSGCFVRITDVLYDVMGGVTHDSSDETAIHQGVLNSLKDGAAYRLSGVSKVTSLTCNANSVTLDSVGSPYSEGGGGFEVIGSGKILTVGGYGWTVSKTVFRDLRPALGSTTAGTCGLWFERYATTVDLDAAVDRCLFSKLDQAVGGKGINVKITANIFSYCRYSVDAYQLGSSQFRGWIVTGSNRFHGRAFDGGAHIRTTGPITASEFNKNFHDDGYKAYEGWLDRTASFSDNEIRGSFSPDYAIDVTGGAYGVVSLNRMGSIGSGGAIRATNTSQLTVFGNSADSVRKHGLAFVNAVNGFVKSNVLTNINILNTTDGDIYDGMNFDATSNSNEIEGNVTRQIGIKGRNGIRNEGSGNYFGINQSSGYVSGDYYQSPTVEAYGYTWNGLVRPRVEYLPAMPTTGRWRRNDIIWSTVAAAGLPMGWICTVAGIAGSTAVFKAMPNLSA